MMFVSDAEPRFQQISEVRLFAPTGKLRSVAKPHVHDSPNARRSQSFDKLAQAFFGKPDGENSGHSFKKDLAAQVQIPLPWI